ncbi:MAG: sigma-54-dependent Fis family transcriptional regulator [Acidobacteria bacterium]|nr:sigma-54-dependent Fis family transcriptional regulator [Acidobacteriota bacterium]
MGVDSNPPNAFSRADLFFASMGRALLLLDGNFNILRAGQSFDGLICEGASQRVPGRALDDMIFGEGSATVQEIKNKLAVGEIDEGRRAYLNCPIRGTRLVSVTSAPTPEEIQSETPGALYFCAIKPAAEDLATRSIGDFVAVSPAIQRIDHLIDLLQQSDATVLITGESGTGKEIIARAIHQRSRNRQGPFVGVNCAAFPDQLLENELFGHRRGAYTGAHRDERGRFELAQKGTLFLDEVGDIPLPLQVKLLRVLQERQFERLGDTQTRKLEARIIAATNRDLEAMVQAGSFRDDLYYRLRVIPIHIPPLRDRPEDIEALARTLLNRLAEKTGKQLFIPSTTMKALLAYPWPGNVREMENALEFASTLCQGHFIQVEDLPQDLRHHAAVTALLKDHPIDRQPEPWLEPAANPPANPNPDPLIETLEQCRWNKSRAAQALGISRTTLWRRMREAGLS